MGGDIGPASTIDNRYAFALPHTAVALTVRAAENSFSAAVPVNLLKNGVIVAAVPIPATGITTIAMLTGGVSFAAGDDIEVQVVIPTGTTGSAAITAIVEFS